MGTSVRLPVESSAMHPCGPGVEAWAVNGEQSPASQSLIVMDLRTDRLICRVLPTRIHVCDQFSGEVHLCTLVYSCTVFT
jgi:hypothetical protein